ncbi:MAG: AMP-binding protein [Acidimicrobiales bacterium]
MFVPFNVKDFLDRAEFAYGHRLGIVDEPDQPAESWGSLTFSEVARRARAQAAGLDALGVKVGERVAVVSHNSARLLTSYFGVSSWGRVLVPVNFRLAAPEVSYIVEHCGASMLLIDPELEEPLAEVKCARRYVLGEASDKELYNYDAEPEPWEADEAATATINYTSGTTARPKGVQLTHRNLWVNAVLFGWHAGVGHDDVYLHTLPMFHASGWGMHFASIGNGVPQIVLRKVDGAEILRRIDKYGVTLMCGAPAVVNAILAAAAEWPGPVPGHGKVRMVVAGAAPPSKTIERMESELGWEFIEIYGLTETSPLLTINRTRSEWADLAAPERARKLMRAGIPAVGVQMAVDAEGEVLARGNVIMEGYWKQPDATEKALAGGWFHTGDGGMIDDENYVNIMDRKKDIIITGGENVSSIEVENAIFSHPAVAEVAVIGIPDEKWGELVAALVVPAAGQSPSEEDIVTYCRSSLAGYKCPKKVEFRDNLPRTATGKLQKFKLREPYWAGMERQVN